MISTFYSRSKDICKVFLRPCTQALGALALLGGALRLSSYVRPSRFSDKSACEYMNEHSAAFNCSSLFSMICNLPLNIISAAVNQTCLNGTQLADIGIAEENTRVSINNDARSQLAYAFLLCGVPAALCLGIFLRSRYQCVSRDDTRQLRSVVAADVHAETGNYKGLVVNEVPYMPYQAETKETDDVVFSARKPLEVNSFNSNRPLSSRLCTWMTSCCRRTAEPPAAPTSRSKLLH